MNMMSSENILAKSGVTKDENQSPGNRKTASTRQQQEQGVIIKCPRCDSPNTKFCYYNNYSLTQPRHFCKTCRRYWTKGGALRNVPIGGGCRKNRKIKSSSSRLVSSDSKDSGSSLEIGGFNFFHGHPPPAMDFHQLSGLSFPRLLNPSAATGICNQFSSFGDAAANPSCCFSLDPSASSSSNNNHLMGFNNNYPLPSVANNNFSGAIQEMGSMNVNSSLASSIESLSSINQDLHLRLQQQRLALLFVGENQKETSSTASDHLLIEPHTEKPQPILFQNLEISKPDASSAIGNSRKEGASGERTATEWFFGNSLLYAPEVTAAVTPTTTTSNDGNGENDNTINSWNGVLSWNDLH